MRRATKPAVKSKRFSPFSKTNSSDQEARFLAIAARLMRQPAVAYHEKFVQREVLQICAENQLPVSADPWGNLIVRLRKGSARRPIVLAAHMDHPGFEIVRLEERGLLQARFLGGVPPQYFRAGTRVRLHPGNMLAQVAEAMEGDKMFRLQPRKPLSKAPEFAVWDLPDYKRKGDLIIGRACDDLIGVAVVLAALIAVKESGEPVHMIGALTRAEEVGFHGALALATSGLVPKNSLVISLEASQERPPVSMGQGVIIRVGDKASVFNSDATRFLTEVASELQSADSGFFYERALMLGGTCEATAYQAHGFTTAAVCVALGNYHNCGKNEKIAPECIHRKDAIAMTQLLVLASHSMPRYAQVVGALPKRLAGLRRTALRRLPAAISLPK